jgi:hypothetical protein
MAPTNPVTTGLQVSAHEEPKRRSSRPRPMPATPPMMVKTIFHFIDLG